MSGSTSFPLRTMVLIDALAGGVSGLGQIALSGWLAPYFGLSRSVLVGMGIVSLCYCTYGLWLRATWRCSAPFFPMLISANFAYGAGVLVLAAIAHTGLRPLGLAYLIVECFLVVVLALWERGVWRTHQRARPGGDSPYLY